MVLNYFGSTPLGYCLLLYSVLDQRSNKMDKKNTFIKCLLYNTWVLSTWIRVLQKKSHSHYSLTCFWPQLYKFFSGLGSRWLGDVSRNCHSSIQCLKTERMLCAWRCFRHLGKQWPIRQNPYLSRPVTKWGWLVIQTSWHDSDRLGGRVFFGWWLYFREDVRKSLLEEVTFDLEPEWQEGGRECLPPLKGHDNLCSRLWRHLKTSRNNSYWKWLLLSSSFA